MIKIVNVYVFVISHSKQFRMNHNNGDKRKHFFKPKSNLVHHHIVFTNQKSFPEEIKITAVEMQELPETEKTVLKKSSCLKSTN